jgi:hypothetical protein
MTATTNEASRGDREANRRRRESDVRLSTYQYHPSPDNGVICLTKLEHLAKRRAA